MTELPQSVKERFFQLLQGTIGIEAFEAWVYESQVLEDVLSEEDYYELIAFHYQKPFALRELHPILEKHLIPGEFETWRLRRLLAQISREHEELIHILTSLYDLYCEGYRFLEKLALDYGLVLKYPPLKSRQYHAGHWSELEPTEREELLDEFFPHIEAEVERVLKWLDEGKIVITGHDERYGTLQFKDRRTDEEKERARSRYRPKTTKT